MNDPTFAWSDTTRQAYETTRTLVVSVLGDSLPINDLSRSEVRKLIEVLRFLPRNAAKLFPKLSVLEATAYAREHPNIEPISPANANSYLGRFSNFLNWCVREELTIRNPAQGLRLPDTVANRDKRHPFSPTQLTKIFHAPLYSGCLDGDRGYNKSGTMHPRNARFWIPLIAIYTGMRLNEICQLDTTDIQEIDGVHCFCITTKSAVGSTDKRVKTTASERLIPIHPTLQRLGMVQYACSKYSSGYTKLFHDVPTGTRDVRAVAFSKWFTQFLGGVGAREERTSFHSFRHNFRDELRHARVDHDFGMAIGGWIGGPSQSASASDNYGRGVPVALLESAIKSLRFESLDLNHLIGDPSNTSHHALLND